MPLNLPEKSPRDDEDVLKRRLLGAAVFIALAVIILPLVLDGSGSESRFRRVEQLRQEPPRIVDPSAQIKIPAKQDIPRPTVPIEPPAKAVSEAVEEAAEAAESATENLEESAAAVAETVEEVVQTSTLSVEPIETVESEPLETIVSEPDQSTPAPAIAETQTASAEVVESVAWVIQAGSFTDEINALKARDQLRKAGHPAYVSQGENAGTFVYRVKVGPINNRQQVESVQKQVESLVRQETLIKQYR